MVDKSSFNDFTVKLVMVCDVCVTCSATTLTTHKQPRIKQLRSKLSGFMSVLSAVRPSAVMISLRVSL